MENYEIEIKGDSKIYKCTLREPGFEELSMAMTAMRMNSGKVNEAKGGKFIVESCWIDGDDEILTNGKLLFTASLRAASLISAFEVDLKKK